MTCLRGLFPVCVPFTSLRLCVPLFRFTVYHFVKWRSRQPTGFLNPLAPGNTQTQCMFAPFGSYFMNICCTRPEIAIWALLSDNSFGLLWQPPSKSSAPHNSLRPSLRAKQEEAKEHSDSSQWSKMKKWKITLGWPPQHLSPFAWKGSRVARPLQDNRGTVKRVVRETKELLKPASFWGTVLAQRK